ncbi:MAG: hypothetical protein Q9224_007756, partial [Gallowayella concinna]
LDHQYTHQTAIAPHDDDNDDDLYDASPKRTRSYKDQSTHLLDDKTLNNSDHQHPHETAVAPHDDDNDDDLDDPSRKRTRSYKDQSTHLLDDNSLNNSDDDLLPASPTRGRQSKLYGSKPAMIAPLLGLGSSGPRSSVLASSTTRLVDEFEYNHDDDSDSVTHIPEPELPSFEPRLQTSQSPNNLSGTSNDSDDVFFTASEGCEWVTTTGKDVTTSPLLTPTFVTSSS